MTGTLWINGHPYTTTYLSPWCTEPRELELGAWDVIAEVARVQPGFTIKRFKGHTAGKTFRVMWLGETGLRHGTAHLRMVEPKADFLVVTFVGTGPLRSTRQ
jgi:hypothetical protein